MYADCVKAQRKLGIIDVKKINNSFQFTDDLLTLIDGSTFEKHYQDIYPTELELKKEKLAILVPLFLVFIFTLKRENFILDYLINKKTLASTL